MSKTDNYGKHYDLISFIARRESMLLPVKLAIMLCVILIPLRANPSISSDEFPFVFEWKRLTGSLNNPVGWTESLFLFSESDGHVVAVDRNTKLVRWRQSVGRGVKTLKILGSRLIYTDSFGTVGILKLEDGTVDWTDSETTGTTAIASSGDLIYINRSDGWLYAHHIDGLPAWQLRVGSGRPTIPLIHNDRIYVGTAMGGILVVDARSGERLQAEDVGIGVGSFVSAAGGLVAALFVLRETSLSTVLMRKPENFYGSVTLMLCQPVWCRCTKAARFWWHRNQAGYMLSIGKRVRLYGNNRS